MQSIGKSLKSAYKICEPDYVDEHSKVLDKLMFDVNFKRVDKIDRGSYVHNYHRPYGKLLGPTRDKIRTVLEVGIWTGMGLLTWAKYFPNCKVVEGIDNTFRYERKIKRLFTDPDSDKIIEYANELSTRGHEVGWFEFPKQDKDDHDSNLIAIKKSHLTTANIPSENPDAPWTRSDWFQTGKSDWPYGFG